jgi:hypothetical protein
MEFKGTKGKWLIDKTNELVNGLPTTELFTPETDTWSGEWIARIRGNTEVERQANALLISKAPEMLVMLKSCVKAFEQLGMKEPIGVTELIKEATEI